MTRIKATVQSLRVLAPSIVELTVTKNNNKFFPDFLPGQYATLSFPAYRRLRSERSFSIASAPTDRRELRFGIRIEGRYTTALSQVQPGDQVLVGGPYGQFTFSPQRDESAVFLAGGIGITPFISMIRTATDLKLPNKLTLYYSVRSLDDAAYREQLDRLAKINPNFRVVYAVTDKKIPNSCANMYPGRICQELLEDTLDDDPFAHSYFLCGPPPFMKAMTEVLVKRGLPSLAIRQERFGINSKALVERGTPVPKLVFAAWGIATVIVLGVVFRIQRDKQTATAATSPIVATGAPASNNTTANIVLPGQTTTPTTASPQPTTPQVTQPSTAPQTLPIMPRTMMS